MLSLRLTLPGFIAGLLSQLLLSVRFLIQPYEFLAHGVNLFLCRRVGVNLLLIPRKLDKVGRLIDACLAHVEHAVMQQPEGLPPALLPCGLFPLSVAADDTARFPYLQVVEEVMAGDSYLAYDELVDIVDAR
jgi:hypothetical protein